MRQVNMAWNVRFVDSYMLNKRAKFGEKIFTHFWEIAIFVLGRFILTHPVYVDCVTLTFDLLSVQVLIMPMRYLLEVQHYF